MYKLSHKSICVVIILALILSCLAVLSSCGSSGSYKYKTDSEGRVIWEKMVVDSTDGKQACERTFEYDNEGRINYSKTTINSEYVCESRLEYSADGETVKEITKRNAIGGYYGWFWNYIGSVIMELHFSADSADNYFTTSYASTVVVDGAEVAVSVGGGGASMWNGWEIDEQWSELIFEGPTKVMYLYSLDKFAWSVGTVTRVVHTNADPYWSVSSFSPSNWSDYQLKATYFDETWQAFTHTFDDSKKESCDRVDASDGSWSQKNAILDEYGQKLSEIFEDSKGLKTRATYDGGRELTYRKENEDGFWTERANEYSEFGSLIMKTETTSEGFLTECQYNEAGKEIAKRTEYPDGSKETLTREYGNIVDGKTDTVRRERPDGSFHEWKIEYDEEGSMVDQTTIDSNYSSSDEWLDNSNAEWFSLTISNTDDN